MINLINSGDVLKFLQLDSDDLPDKVVDSITNLIFMAQSEFELKTNHFLGNRKAVGVKIEPFNKDGLYVGYQLPIVKNIKLNKISLRYKIYERVILDTDNNNPNEGNEGFGKDFYIEYNLLKIRSYFLKYRLILDYTYGNNYTLENVPENIKYILIKMTAKNLFLNYENSLELVSDTEKGNLLKEKKFDVLKEDLDKQIFLFTDLQFV